MGRLTMAHSADIWQAEISPDGLVIRAAGDEIAIILDWRKQGELGEGKGTATVRIPLSQWREACRTATAAPMPAAGGAGGR